MVVIELPNGTLATYSEYKWHTSDSMLKALLDMSNTNTIVKGSEPDVDMAYAKSALKRFGGKIVTHVPPVFDENVEY